MTPQQRYYQKNKAALQEKARAKYREPERHAKVQAYRDKNKSRQQEYCKQYYKENREKLLDAANQYYENNTESVKARNYEYYLMKMDTDPTYKLTQYMRSRVRNAINLNAGTKRDRTFDLVGCTAAELRLKLEAKFTEGMTWDNYGEWHVDHIKPCASFDMALDSEQKLCFHYSNLQPLWAEDNIRKSDNYE